MSGLKIRQSKLNGVLVIEPPTNFVDFRGSYVETYHEAMYRDAGITADFVQDDISTSKKDVLRGLHGDQKTWKLISCLYGRFFFVIVNWDETSPQFGEWETFDLSDKNRLQVLVPPKFGNGHLVLSDVAIFHYKQSSYYDRAGQFTIPWNNKKLGIPWPVTHPILSDRDAGNVDA